MKYPSLIIDTKKIYHNTKTLVNLCKQKNIEVAGVTKVFCALPEVVNAMVEGGITIIADSRLENLKTLDKFNLPKMLLRLPMISDSEEVVRVCDYSLNSEIETLKALDAGAREQCKIHNVILMIDLGDLREGIWFTDLLDFIEGLLSLKNLCLAGIGTNLTCYGGVIPEFDNLNKLVVLAKEIELKYRINIPIISGGNSSSLHLIYKDQIPNGITMLRLGESIVLGRETAFGNNIENTYQDCFTLELEIIELKTKPSVPIGQIGMDAFGNTPVFTDKGNIIRGILAAGRQDLAIDGLIPQDDKLEIIGASSDHLIINFSNSENKYKVGDIIKFNLTYGGILAASTSKYITKVIL